MQPRPAFNIDKKANSMDFRALQVDNGDSGYRADIKTDKRVGRGRRAGQDCLFVAQL